jgi:hypothetical protein
MREKLLMSRAARRGHISTLSLIPLKMSPSGCDDRSVVARGLSRGKELGDLMGAVRRTRDSRPSGGGKYLHANNRPVVPTGS